MSCKRYAGELADAVAGESLTAGFQAHLQECETCRRRLVEGRQVLAALDRELGEALAIEPSAALLARVKDRVALVEPAPVDSSRVAAAWRIAATVAVAAGVAGSVWLLRPGVPGGKALPRIANASPSAPVGSPRAAGLAETAGVGEDAGVGAGIGAAPAEVVASLPPGPPVAAGGTQPPPRRPNAPAKPARRGSTHASEPEVLMPPGEAALFDRFVASLRTRTVDPSSLLVARSAEDLPEPKPIDVSPLEILPLSGDLEPVDDGRTE